MSTITKRHLGPTDHGTELTLDEYEAADYEPGTKYELIDGRLYVSPLPDLPQDSIEKWVLFKLHDYCRARPDVANHVTDKARVFVPGSRPSSPEPDLAVYRDFPLDARWDGDLHWRDVSPILVVEILSPEAPNKDLVRNVALYLRLPSIREYWIVDNLEEPGRPSLTVYRRRGARWQKPIGVRFGATYTTKLLPEFDLIVDPRRRSP